MWGGQVDQWNRTEGPEKEPHKYRQQMFDAGAKQSEYSGSVIVLDNWTATGRKMNLDTDLTPFTESNSEWIIT